MLANEQVVLMLLFVYRIVQCFCRDLCQVLLLVVLLAAGFQGAVVSAAACGYGCGALCLYSRCC